MSKSKTIKVKVSETLEVNVAAWAMAFGIEEKDVRADVQAYFANWCASQIETLGVGK